MSEHDCNSCSLTSEPMRSRREFLREAGTGAIAALLSIGVLPSIAKALPLSFADPLSARGANGEKAYAVPGADSVSIDKDEELILVRWQGAIYAFALSCPHQNTALRWNEGDHQFQCPKHHSKYRPDGTFISGRATRSMDRYAIRKAGNAVSVNFDALYQEDENKAQWEAAVIRV